MLTLHVNQVQIKATQAGVFTAFAALLSDGSVVTWGPADYGGTAVRTGAAVRCAADPSFHSWHLLQSWAMDLSSPGVMLAMVATAVRYRIS